MLTELYIKSYVQRFGSLKRPFWNYEDGCVLTALQALYEAEKTDFYREAMEKFISPYIMADGNILWYHPEEYSLDQIPSGRSLLFLYNKTKEKRYLMAAGRLAQQLLHQPCTEEGSFWHKKIYPNQVWLDGLYMASPFCLLYAAYSDQEYWIRKVMTQFKNARAHLFAENKGLYYHAWDEKRQQFWCDQKTGLSQCFWSRAMGWFVMALADCWEILDRYGDSRKEYLKNLWKEAIGGILPYQDEESGLFWQLMDQSTLEGNYLETSASAMLAYSLLKGVRYGVFGKKEEMAAASILCGLESRCFSVTYSGGRREIHIGGICAGAGLGPENRPERDGSPAYYLSEKQVCDEQKGVAAVMLAYSEWVRLVRDKKANVAGIQAGFHDVWILRHKNIEGK